MSNGSLDVFLSRFDKDGNFVWARTWGGPDDDCGYSVSNDGSGSEYVTGFFQDTVDFNPAAEEDFHTSNGQFDAFLSKLDSNGNYVWARTWGGFYNDSGISVAIDGLGNEYVTGYFQDTVDFDPGPQVDDHVSCYLSDIFYKQI